MNVEATISQLEKEKNDLSQKYQTVLNKFAERNRNLELCKQFLQVLLEWDFNKIGATQVYRERVRNFLKNME